MSNSDWIALLGLVGAVCALGFTLWQLKIGQAHNRLSVRPYLVSRRMRRRGKDGTAASFELLNVGLGPALIREFKVTVDNQAVSSPHRDPIEELIARCLDGKVSYTVLRTSFPGVGYCMRLHEEYMVAEVFFPKSTRADEKLIDQLLERGELDVSYESFYGMRDVFSTRNKKQSPPVIEKTLSEDVGQPK